MPLTTYLDKSMAEEKSLGAIKYNALPLDLHSLELYVTEGGITMCFHFVIFFLQHLVLALSGLLKPCLQLLFLETDWWYFVIWKSLIPYKQNTVWCIVLEVRKLPHQKKKYLQWQTTSSKDFGLLHWIFSKLLWKCWWDSQWEGFFIWENRCSKGICLWSLLSQCAPSGLRLLAVGLTSSEPLGRREIWNCLYHLTLHPDDLPSSWASWC